MNIYLDLISKVFLNMAMAGVFFYYIYQLLHFDWHIRDVVFYLILASFMVLRQYLLPREYILFSLLLYVVMFCYMAFLYHIPWKNAVLLTMLFYFCSRYVNQTVAWVSYQYAAFDYINGGTSFVLRMICCTVFPGIVWLTILLLRPYIHNIVNIPVEWKEFLTLCVIVAPLIYFNHAHTLINVSAYELPFAIVLSRIGVSLCAVVLLTGYFALQKAHQQSLVEDQLNHLLRLQTDRQTMQKEYGDYILSKCHDLKKQLFLFKEQSEKEYLTQYMEELEQRVSSFDRVISTGNKVLDAIVNEKAEICRANHIDFQIILNGEMFAFLNPMDMVSMFSNALDNAIEACLKISDLPKRSIRVNTMEAGNFICTVFANTFAHVNAFTDGSFPTTSKAEPGHGYGLKSIQFIAKKYNGSVHAEIQNEEFVLTVLIQKTC